MKLIFATHNAHKVRELQGILPAGMEMASLAEIGFNEEIEETGATIEENSLLKGQVVFEALGQPCIADDSGLEVTCLNGAPGVYSARYAGPARDDHANMDKLLLQLEEAADRSAQFKTVITLVLAKDRIVRFTGVMRGFISRQKTGSYGFGYDPIFVPEGYQKTFAEMLPDEKNKISHRASAVKQLIDHLEAGF